MKQKHYLLLGIVVILGVVLIISNFIPKKNPTISDIVGNPRLYEGKIVTIECKYGNWERCQNCKAPAVMNMSAVCVYDEDGCIYASGSEIVGTDEYLGAQLTLDEPLILRARVIVTDGVAMLSRP